MRLFLLLHHVIIIVIIVYLHIELINHDGAPSPVCRSSHAAVCLNYGRHNPQLLVTGGWDRKKVLSDAWILDLESWRWREVRGIIIIN